MIAGVFLHRWVPPALVAAVTVLAAVFVSSVGFNGELVGTLGRTSEEGRAFAAFEANYPNREGEEVFYVTSEDFGSPENYAALENLVFELLLTPDVEAVFSVFALPGENGVPLLEGFADDGRDEAGRIDGLFEKSPYAEALITRDRTGTLVIVQPFEGTDTQTFLGNLDAATALFEEQLGIYGLGVNALEREISSALMRDQRILTPVSIVVCVLATWLLLGSWRAALVSGGPAVIAILWFLGYLGITGSDFDFLVALIPTIITVLALADAVHIYFAAIKARAAGAEPEEALQTAFRATLPAAIMTTATSAIAFLSLLVVGGAALTRLALTGAVGMVLALLAVLMVFPFLWRLTASGPLPKRIKFGDIAHIMQDLRAHGLLITGIGAALFLALLGIKSQSEIGFGYEDNIPRGSVVEEVFFEARDAGLGTGSLFVVLPDADGVPGVTQEDTARIKRAFEAVYEVDVNGTLEDLPTNLVALDGLSYAIPVPLTLGLGSTEVDRFAREVEARVQAADLPRARVVGHSLFATRDIPPLIQDLRLSFYIALIFIAVIAAFTLRSATLAAVAIVPNVMPIFFVEALMVLFGRPIGLADAVAMVVAFGIAVDDSVHFLNRYRIAKAAGEADPVGTALRIVTAPIMVTTILLVLGFLPVIFSLLPTITAFGIVVSLALIAALVIVLGLLPSLLDRVRR